MEKVGNLTNQMVATLGLVTEEQYLVVNDSCAFVWALLSFLGIISNIINIRIFIAMGLNDGVIVSFLALAIFDLAYLIVSFSLGITTAIYVIELRYGNKFAIEPFGVKVYFFNITILINVGNMLVTTYLAFARCMCIARPVQFKYTFTRRKAIVLSFGFAIFAIVSYLPIFVYMGMWTQTDPRTNISRPMLWLSPKRESIKNIVWAVIDVFLPCATEIIVIVCIFVMTKCLRQAATFRQTSSASAATRKHKMMGPTNITGSNSDPSSGVSDKLTGKDLRVIQQIVLISLVYIMCNTPKILISVVAMIEHEFRIGRRYSRLYLCVNSLGKNFEVCNSAINLIIYYKYNTKFRAMLQKKH